MSEVKNELYELSKKWINDFKQDTTGTLYDWTEETAKSFARVPVETLIRDPYFLGFGDKVYDGVLEDIVSLFTERKKRAINLAIFLEGIGSGKCLLKDSILLTKQGFINLEDLDNKVPFGFSPLIKSIQTRNGFKDSNNFYKEKVRKGIRIRTHLGYSLGGTLEHPCLINGFWTKLKDAKINDKITIQIKEENWEGINTWTEDEAYLMGFHLGDGHLHDNGHPGAASSSQFTISKNDTDFYEYIINLAKDVGMKVTYLSDKRRGNFRFRLKWHKENNITSKWPKELWGNISEKCWPKSILMSPKHIIRAFIQGLMDADGSNNKKGGISISSVNREIVSTLQIILSNFGILSTLRPKKTLCNGKRGIAYRLKINSVYADMYMEKIGFRMARKNIQKSIIRTKVLSTEPLYDDYIEEIEEIEDQFYDLEIPEGHEFIANSFIVHNTVKSSIIMWLLWFELSLHASPQAHFQLAPDSVIAIINLNRTEKQSKKVTFAEVWNRFQTPFNRDYFPVSDKWTTEIRIPRNNTTIFPGTSSALSALGYNLYSGIIDEAAFLEVVEDSTKSMDSRFDMAESMYNAIMNRMVSRFLREGNLPGLICMISSPNFPDDFMHKMIDVAEKQGESSGIFYRRRNTWEAKGKKFFPEDEYFYIDTDTGEIIEDSKLNKVLDKFPKFPLEIDIDDLEKIAPYYVEGY